MNHIMANASRVDRAAKLGACAPLCLSAQSFICGIPSGNPEIEIWCQTQRENCRDAKPADDRPSYCDACFSTRAGCQNLRQAPEHRLNHRHHHVPDPQEQGVVDVFSRLAQLAGDLDNQDTIFGHHLDQQHKANLTVVVK